MSLNPRRAGLAVLALLAAFLLACSSEGSELESEPTLPPAGSPLAPDLAVAPIEDLQVGTAPDGRRLLFFSATIVNLGDGPLLLSGTRSDDGWTLAQRVQYSESGEETIPMQFSMIFGGDGHDHWHVAEAARYRLTALGDAEGTPKYDAKVGFCFFDQVVYREDLVGGATEPQHASHECGHEDARVSEMGLSVGWGDPYQWFLPGQSIDVTGVPDGRYRLEAIVDSLGRFRETNVANNITWVEFEMETRELDGLPLIEILGVSDQD